MTHLSHPYLTEVYLRQERHQLRVDAERHGAPHHDCRAGTGRPQRNKTIRPARMLSWWRRPQLAAAR
jgi:hypothetical protein